ncbi:MAG TPA: RagB/SusD family nutrient uptake outer membrane protein [Puia sp.]
MRFLNQIAVFAAAVSMMLAGVSCKKSFLELSDPTRIETSNYYKDSASIATAVNACYSSMMDIYGRLSGSRGIFVFADVPSDESYSPVDGAGIGDFEYFNFTSTNTNLQTSWQMMYRGIARCNIVISRAPAVPMSDSARQRLMAEAKFMRAMTYFNAVRIWGDIPLVTEEIPTVQDAYKYGRAKTVDVYARIITDLKEAAAFLPVKYTAPADIGRITRGAALGILGKVYLTMNNYTEAAATLGDFITTIAPGTYSLQSSYANIFLTSNEMNSEIIAAVRYKKGGTNTGSLFDNYFGPPFAAVVGIGNGYMYNLVRKELYDNLRNFDALSKDSIRFKTSFGFTGGSYYYTKKYLDMPTTEGDADNDWIILRYADVLLMYAEALNELNPGNVAAAVPYINQVRTRAGFSGVGLLPATLTQDQLRTAIQEERRMELNMEGHRWFDLVRTGKAIEVMNKHFIVNGIKVGNNPVQIDAHNLLFPIPITEINTNPIITQNTGY